MDSESELVGFDNTIALSPEIIPNEESIPIQLTSSKSHSLQTSKVEYIDDLPEYPTSHIHGYSYVVASSGRSQSEMEQLVHEIQYSRRQQHGPRRPVKSPFLNCLVKRWTWKCSGIYACEYLNSYLQSYHHTFVNKHCWSMIRKSQEDTQILETDIGKQNAYSYYRSKKEFFTKGHACLDQLPTCKPVFKRHAQMDIHGENPPYIGCSNGSNEFLTKHHRGSIQGHTLIDLQFLEDLFNRNIMPATEECGTFESLASRRKYCDRDHLQGPGRLKRSPCSVIFNALVPVNIDECPYILFTSHGIHEHPPPPPSKAPERILQGVKNIIQQIRDPSLTTAQFLRNPQLEAFCQQYNASTLAEIHSSFCNKDRIAAIIQKEQLLSYPNGQDINGLLFLQNRDSLVNEYVQEKHHDSQGTMVFCGFKDQICLLSTLSSFEVDMSFKRIRSKEINEVLFATFMPDQCKILTLLRVFTTMDSTEGYYLLFKRAFHLIQRISGKPVLFDPIHGSGIYGIIVDMNPKQYTGLGQYLSEIDPRHRDPIWHLEHIIIFCRVHFQRSILKVIGTKNEGSGLWSRMMSLLDCQSEDEYNKLIKLLIKYESPEVQTWASQKKSPVIKAGLNQSCSKIQPRYFNLLRNHTNAVEQSHQKSYASGKYLTLVEAVQNSAKLDKDDILQYQNYQRFNIHNSYRASTIEANYLRYMSRERGRKRRRSSSVNERCSQASSRIPEAPHGNIQTLSRSSSSSRVIDNESTSSSRNLHRVTPANILTIEQRRQELELRDLEAEVKRKEEEVRLKQLQNEQLELELIRQRIQIRKEQQID